MSFACGWLLNDTYRTSHWQK